MSNALQEFQGALAAKRGGIVKRLPVHMRGNVDQFVTIAVTAAAKNPKILQCSQESVMLSIMAAAEIGLNPGGSLGEGYLVPYGSTCQFIPGYRGLISLARRSGQIVSLEAHAVHEKDVFDVEFGLESKLSHKPSLEADRGTITAVYAIARLVGGGIQYDYMTRSEVEDIRKRSRAGTSGPWVTDFAEMAKKTVIRRLFKMLPVSTEMLSKALELQAQAESGDFDPSLEVMQADAQTTDDLNAAAAAAAANREASK
ncbi:MAG: recombination protein RecT [Fibrobacterota bacterium]|jgi:recombination protein RecT